ncbi:MAG TPA: CPBP family intramembrane glutamic endopeptidase, partial [Opitutaceae bacterium]
MATPYSRISANAVEGTVESGAHGHAPAEPYAKAPLFNPGKIRSNCAATMTDSPFVLLVITAVGVYVAKLWRDDLIARRRGTPNPRALPGATPAPTRALVVAAAGGFSLVAIETAGESAFGLTAQQSQITVLFGLYTLVAAVIEEIIFRGFIVIERRGVFLRWAGIAGASVLFAALHPFLWKWNDGDWAWTLDAKGWFSTAIVFASSLWFYTVRFARLNPQRSL